MDKIKTLVADDSEILMNNLISEINKFEECEIIGTAFNGEDEYNKILSLNPDIVFTDNQMPKMNGIDVIEKVFNSDIESKPYFAMITSDTGAELIKKSRELNFTLLHKPINNYGVDYALSNYKFNIEKKSKENELICKEEKKENIFIKIINLFKNLGRSNKNE